MSMEYKQGLLELDLNKTDKSTNKIIQAVIEKSKIPNLKNLLINNPVIYDKLQILENFKNNSVINNILTWLDSFKSRLAGIEQICKIRGLSSTSITIQQLIQLFYSYLIDASFLKNITIIDESGKVRNRYIQVSGAVYITKTCLTDLAEHARQFRKYEISGFLIGKRNLNGIIQEITRYIPLLKGSESRAIFNQIDLIKTARNLDNKNEMLIGSCHSHPGMGVPTFSISDKRLHLFFAKFSSIYNYLNGLNTRISEFRKLNFSAYLTNYKITQIKYILAVIRIMLKKRLRIPFALALRHFSRNFSFLTQIKNDYNSSIMKEPYNPYLNKDLQERINEAYIDLKLKLQNLLDTFKLKPKQVEFYLAPFAGAVICPQSRYFSIIDSNYESQKRINWIYYRIIVKKN